MVLKVNSKLFVLILCLFQKAYSINPIVFSFPDLEFDLEAGDEVIHLQAFKSFLNDDYLYNFNGYLNWYSIGHPKLVLNKNDSLFNFNKEGFYLNVDTLTNDHKRKFKEIIKRKYKLDVDNSQIMNLILDRLECHLRYYDSSSNQEILDGRVKEFNTFPLKVEFNLPLWSETRRFFESIVKNKPVQDLDILIECEANANIKSIDESSLTISVEQLYEIGLIEKLFEFTNSTFLNQEQLDNLASEVYKKLNIFDRFKINSKTFKELFIQDLIRQTSEDKMLKHYKLEQILKQTHIHDIPENVNIYKLKKDAHELLKVNNESIELDQETWNNLKSKLAEIKQSGKYLDFLRFDYVDNLFALKLSNKNDQQTLNEKLKDLNDNDYIQWKLDGDRIIPIALNLALLHKSHFEQDLKFIDIKTNYYDSQFKRVFKLSTKRNELSLEKVSIYESIEKTNELIGQFKKELANLIDSTQNETLNILNNKLNDVNLTLLHEKNNSRIMLNLLGDTHADLIKELESLDSDFKIRTDNLNKKFLFLTNEIDELDSDLENKTNNLDKKFLNLTGEIENLDSDFKNRTDNLDEKFLNLIDSTKNETSVLIDSKIDDVNERITNESKNSQILLKKLQNKFFDELEKSVNKSDENDFIIKNQITDSNNNLTSKVNDLDRKFETKSENLNDDLVAVKYNLKDIRKVVKKISNKVFDPRTESLSLRGHSGWIWALTVLQNGYLASGSDDNLIKIWNSFDGTLIRTLIGHKGYIVSLATLQNGYLASGSSDKTIKIWNPSDGLLIRTINAHSKSVHALAVLLNGDLASASVDKTIKIWDVNNGTLIRTLHGHTDWIKALAVLQNGDLASGSDDHTIKIWNPVDGALIRTLTGHTDWVKALVVLSNGHLVSGSGDKTIKIWDPTDGSLIRSLYSHSKSVASLAVLQNGHLASGSEDYTIKIWNPYTGDLIRSLAGHSDYIRSLNVLQTGELVSGSDDKTIKIWN